MLSYDTLGDRDAVTPAQWEELKAQTWQQVAQSSNVMATAMQTSGILQRHVRQDTTNRLFGVCA